MRRMLTGSVAVAVVTAVVALPAWAVSLEPDPSFSGNGSLRMSLKAGAVDDLAKDGDQILAAGGYRTDTDKLAIFVARFNGDGTLDSGYGTGGVATTLVPGAGSVRLAVQSDGAAVTVTRRDKIMVAHRWTPDGQLDTTFSDDGVRELPFGALHPKGSGLVTVDSDGRILSAALTYARHGENTRIVRLNPDGSRDSTFGGDGVVTIDLDRNDTPLALTVDRTGRAILGLGFIRLSTGELKYAGRAGVVRLRPNGAYDKTFSDDGLFLFRLYPGKSTLPMDVGIDSSNRIVVAAHDYSTQSYGAVRLQQDGDRDPNFGYRGMISVGCTCSVFTADVQDGNVAFGGTRELVAGRNAIVARIDDDGTRTLLWEGDLLSDDTGEFTSAVLVDGRRTVLGGNSLNVPFLARLK
jgi:uncharacterized delta-60 repeat protein